MLWPHDCGRERQPSADGEKGGNQPGGPILIFVRGANAQIVKEAQFMPRPFFLPAHAT
jgi:hypothetical protein